ncbi:MAG: rhodanese-like domain-containing protein [Myxococcota bacterium]
MTRWLLWGLTGGFVGCGSSEPVPVASVAKIQQIDAAALRAKLKAGEVPILVDVRTPGERERGSIPGSVGIPLDELPNRLNELEAYQDDLVYLVCQSGSRSMRAAGFLAEHGFTTVNIKDGTGSWKAQGWPVE